MKKQKNKKLSKEAKRQIVISLLRGSGIDALAISREQILKAFRDLSLADFAKMLRPELMLGISQTVASYVQCSSPETPMDNDERRTLGAASKSHRENLIQLYRLLAEIDGLGNEETPEVKNEYFVTD